MPSPDTPPRKETVQQAEQKAATQLKAELSKHVETIEAAFNLIGKTVSTLPERPLHQIATSQMVASNLLIRIANDLRCVANLTSLGYPLQALTVCTATYESAFTVAYIASDEALAKAWCNHQDPKSSFCDVWTLTVGGLQKLGVTDAKNQAGGDYKAYRQLCWAKHINPLLQIQYGLQQVGKDVLAQNGPDLTEVAVRSAWWVLDRAIRLAYISLASFVNSHIPEESRGTLPDEINSLGSARQQLAKTAIKRWGNEDPFERNW